MDFAAGPIEEPPKEIFLLDQELDGISWGFRALLYAFFFFFGMKFIATPLDWEKLGGFWHLVNLPFHEAGHIFFGIFPPLITSAGGSLMQLIMPLVCGGTLLFKTRDTFGAAICLWWFGQNFLDIAPYIADARAGVMPLLGGNTGQNSPYGFHDWEFILGELRLLHLDQKLANFSFGIGKFIIIVSLIWGFLILWRAWFRPKSKKTTPYL